MDKELHTMNPPAYTEKQSLHDPSLPVETDKRLLIWHAPTGNSIITAADERTLIYNVMDSRAPPPPPQQDSNYQPPYDAQSGMQRTDPKDPQYGKQQYQLNSSTRPNPYSVPKTISQLWTLTFRRDNDSPTSPPLAVVQRHINSTSAISVLLNGVSTGISQHRGSMGSHTKYEVQWEGRAFVWQRTHHAPGTSILDSGNFVCTSTYATGKKIVYAYIEGKDTRHDGTIIIQDVALSDGVLDLIVISGFCIWDLENERRNPSYMRGNCYGGPYAGYYGFYPTPLFFPFLLF